ncbi:hypothetical protein WH43_18780 [Rheinheimera sp. KL1]|uniref:hypothetical protein n=1 Tax=Rheinheimera sp. KL1 TaxID=1635005 RepID=UPI0006A96F67|nr:hypothetical protein [Rheinheimera sp. KL1]KOO56710.1 hypothetical protein WH43_18780 [Rheinheimera sp. KL1]
MILSQKTLESLRDMINEKTEYRSGPQLVQFFNQLGYKDKYGQGFPPRWMFTDQKLRDINGTPQIDECIKRVFAPVNFIGRVPELDVHLQEFNKYLAFDKWRLVRIGAELTFKRLEKVEIDESPASSADLENSFLTREFSNVSVQGLGLEGPVVAVLEQRVKEIEKCFSVSSPLAVILLAGSTLEGILLGLATQHPRHFNTARPSPKDGNGKVRQFQDWSLSNFIDVARELSIIQHDTHKFSHSLRDFRNYIHPFEQMASGFAPRENTAKICLQVLKSAIHDLHENIGVLRT